MKWLLAIALLIGTAEAKLGVDVSWGFMQGKAIFLDPLGDVASAEMKSGSMWEYVSINFTHGKQDSVMSSWGVGVHGFTAKSSAVLLGSAFQVKTTSLSTILMSRRFLTDPGQKTRLYVKGGPSLTKIDLELTSRDLLFPINEDAWKFGVSGAIGVRHRVNPTFTLLL